MADDDRCLSSFDGCDAEEVRIFALSSSVSGRSTVFTGGGQEAGGIGDSGAPSAISRVRSTYSTGPTQLPSQNQRPPTVDHTDRPSLQPDDPRSCDGEAPVDTEIFVHTTHRNN